ncbi:MAG TPA: hypothetical protein VN538_12675 [Clostridia bacterium]|nr:hypothetical protein [Clostridia bacterium]
MGKSEEIRVVIKADSKQLGRELTSSEKAILKAKGIVQSASGSIEGSSKSWAKYRTTAVSEMNKAVDGVRKAQEKVRQIRAQIQSTTMSDNDVEPYIQAYKSMNRSPEQIQSMVAEMQRPSPELQQQYDTATAELDRYKKAAEEAGQSIEYLNQRVAESAQAESAQSESVRMAAAKAKEQARAAREAASANASGAKSSGAFGSGLGKFAKNAIFAVIGAASLYAMMRKLISAMLETAKADTQLSSSLGQIKGNLSIAFQSIYQAALPALRALLSMLVTVTNAIAQLMSRVFGISWGAASKGAKDYASAVGGAGGAAKAAANNMMGIDELNVMQSEAGGGGGGSGGFASIFGLPISLSERWKTFFSSAQYALQEIKGLWDAIKQSAKEAWDEKKAELLTTLATIVSNIFLIVGNIAKAWKEAWQKDDSGQRTFSALLGIGTGLLGIIEDISGAIKTWSETADLSPITTSFAYLWEAVERLVGSIRDALKPIWETFFGPSMDLSIDALGFFVNWLGIGIDVISILVSAFGILVQAISSGFTFIQEVLSGGSVKDAWGKFKTDFLDGFDTSWNNIKESWAGIGQGAVNMFGEGIMLGAPQAQSNAEGVAELTNEKFAMKKQGAKDAGTEIANSYAEGVSASTDAITKALAETPTADAATQLGADLMAGFSQGISDNTVMVMDALGSSITAGKDSAISAAKQVANDAKTEVLTIVDTMADEIYTSFSKMFEKIHFDFDFMLDAVQSDIEFMVQACNKALDKIRSQISINVTMTLSSGGGNFQPIGGRSPELKRGGIIHAAAGGGGFSMGQLFIAREAGPEIVAGIGGGRTAVMNNNQIVESVSNGVYQAVVDAMNSTAQGETGDFVVNLDGQVLLRAMRKAERSAGYQLSGSPTFA